MKVKYLHLGVRPSSTTNKKYMKNIIDAIVINGIIYNRVEAKTDYTCDECDLEEICSNDSDFSCMCNYACDSGYMWKVNNKLNNYGKISN